MRSNSIEKQEQGLMVLVLNDFGDVLEMLKCQVYRGDVDLC